MKIAMIGHKRVPSRSGGVEVVVTELSRNMAELGNTVTIFNRCYGSERLETWEGCKIIEIPTPPAEKKTSALWYSLRAVLKADRMKFDVIHFHAEGPCAMIPIARLFGKTCVATIHGLDWQRSKWGGFAAKYLLFGEKMAAKYADRVIVLSKGVEQYFLEKYNRKTTLIPNGITRIPFREPDLIKKYGLKKDNFILFLARITPEKGLHYLIDAYQKINTDIPLVIAGSLTPENDYIREIKNMAEKDSRIVFTGFVQGQLLEELYSNCRLYVLPSEIEGMPMSLLEAVSFRAPCLVSDIPENKDIAMGYLNLFHSGDADDLKLQLERILNEPVHRTSEEDTDIVLKDHDWKEITRRTLEEYKIAKKRK